MRIVFVGPPGSGKGTQAKLLAERFGLRLIGTGDLLRAAVRDGTANGKLAEQLMVRGELVPDSVVNAIVSDFFLGPHPPDRFILDGYPRNVSQAAYLEKTLAGCGLPLTKVILFSVPTDEIVRRLDTRRQAENRADDNAATVRQRLVTYEAETRPIVDFYRSAGLLAEVNAVGDIETIQKQVVDLLR